MAILIVICTSRSSKNICSRSGGGEEKGKIV